MRGAEQDCPGGKVGYGCVVLPILLHR